MHRCRGGGRPCRCGGGGACSGQARARDDGTSGDESAHSLPPGKRSKLPVERQRRSLPKLALANVPRRMSVPLFDTHTPVAPLIGAIDAKLHEVIAAAASSSVPRSPRSRTSSRPTSARRTRSASRTAPTRSRSRCARSASARATRSSCRRSPSTRRPRRSRRPARRPVFCDVDPETFCVTAETVRAALTPRTKAVIVVHLFGNVAPVARDRGARRAGGRGRRAGRRLARPRRPRRARSARRRRSRSSRPRTSARSATAARSRRDDDAVAERVRMLRFHGSRDKQTFELVGHNSRLDELQAAILRVQLPHLDAWCGRPPRRRRALRGGRARRARRRCRVPVDGAEPAWHLYVVRHERADELAAALKAAGIGQKAYYRVPDAPPAGDARVRAGPSSCRAPTRRRARTSRSR